MSRRLKRSSRCIDVYASPTLDEREGKFVLGGPLYYAQFALRSAGLTVTVRWPFRVLESRSSYTIYSVADVGGVKRLLLRQWSRWSSPLPWCEAALFSPVYHDFPTHTMGLARHYKYCIVDIQGFTRHASNDGIVYRLPLPQLLWDISNCILKIGADDVRSLHDIVRVVEEHEPRRLLVTFNGRGFALIDFERNTMLVARVRRVNVEAVGAGDMFNSILLARLVEGASLEEAVLEAAELVGRILSSKLKSGTSSRNDSSIVAYVERLPCAGCYLDKLVILANYR